MPTGGDKRNGNGENLAIQKKTTSGNSTDPSDHLFIYCLDIYWMSTTCQTLTWAVEILRENYTVKILRWKHMIPIPQNISSGRDRGKRHSEMRCRKRCNRCPLEVQWEKETSTSTLVRQEVFAVEINFELGLGQGSQMKWAHRGTTNRSISL